MKNLKKRYPVWACGWVWPKENIFIPHKFYSNNHNSKRSSLDPKFFPTKISWIAFTKLLELTYNVQFGLTMWIDEEWWMGSGSFGKKKRKKNEFFFFFEKEKEEL